jgi:hypothetical protein
LNLRRFDVKSTNADVATVLALEAPATALLEAIDAAWPAIERLEKAKYAGADWMAQAVGQTTDDTDDGTLAGAVEALVWFRESAGDLGAFDYRFHGVAKGRNTLGEAAAEILHMGDDDEGVQRVVAMQQYAATATR